MIATVVGLVLSLVGLGWCFWYVFVRKEPESIVTPTARAFHAIAAALGRAADEFEEGPERALCDAIRDIAFGCAEGVDEERFLHVDAALQHALASVATKNRVARACLAEAQARLTSLRASLTEVGWFGGTMGEPTDGPSARVLLMRQIADQVDLATQDTGLGEIAPTLRALHKSIPVREEPTPSGVVRIELEVGTLLEHLSETTAASRHLRAALRLIAQVKSIVPGAVSASWETV